MAKGKEITEKEKGILKSFEALGAKLGRPVSPASTTKRKAPEEMNLPTTAQTPKLLTDYGFARENFGDLLATYGKLVPPVTTPDQVIALLQGRPELRAYSGVATYVHQFLFGQIAVVDIAAMKKAGKGIDQIIYSKQALGMAAVGRVNARIAYAVYVEKNRDKILDALMGEPPRGGKKRSPATSMGKRGGPSS